jgi:hypothetical protein
MMQIALRVFFVFSVIPFRNPPPSPNDEEIRGLESHIKRLRMQCSIHITHIWYIHV